MGADRNPSLSYGVLTRFISRRHLLRLWLRDPENAWESPKALDWRWDQLYKNITPDSQVFPLEPYIRSASNKGR